MDRHGEFLLVGGKFQYHTLYGADFPLLYRKEDQFFVLLFHIEHQTILPLPKPLAELFLQFF